MRRILAVLGLLATTLFAVSSPAAEAGEIPPTVEFDRAWTVAKGAAWEVAYIVTCPDPADRAAGYRHALATDRGYLEFRCSPKPRRIVMLLPGPAPAKGESVTLNATVYTQQCFYFDSSDLENGERGCWKISRTDTTRPRPGAFEPASKVDIGSHIDVRNVERTPDGGLRLTARFSCLGGANFGYAGFEARQMTRAGYTESRILADPDGTACDNEVFRRTVVLPPAQYRPFSRRNVVITADWVQSEEGGPWAYYSGLHRLR